MPTRTHQRPGGERPRRPSKAAPHSARSPAPVESDPYLLVGRNPVREALRAGRHLQRLWILDGERQGSIREIEALARQAQVPMQFVPRARLEALAGDMHHQGVVASALPRPMLEMDALETLVANLDHPAFLMLLDGIQDPGNLGALLRVAHAAGCDAVLLPERRSSPITAAVSKAAAGAVEYVSLVRVGNVAQTVERMQDWGISVYASAPQGQIPYTEADWRRPVAVVIGSEGQGVRELVLKRSDLSIRLPMAGAVASLNAATAAAVLCYECVRQRGRIG